MSRPLKAKKKVTGGGGGGGGGGVENQIYCIVQVKILDF